MSIGIVIVFVVSNLLFLFLGLVAGYYIYFPRDNAYTPNPVGLIPAASRDQKIYAVKPLTAEEQEKKGTKREAEEKEMTTLLDRILPVSKK